LFRTTRCFWHIWTPLQRRMARRRQNTTCIPEDFELMLPPSKLIISIRISDPYNLIFTCENAWSYLQIHYKTDIAQQPVAWWFPYYPQARLLHNFLHLEMHDLSGDHMLDTPCPVPLCDVCRGRHLDHKGSMHRKGPVSACGSLHVLLQSCYSTPLFPFSRKYRSGQGEKSIGKARISHRFLIDFSQIS
jgi:hypothetical protein